VRSIFRNEIDMMMSFLWKRIARARTHGSRIAAVDEPVSVHIGSEVGGIRRLSRAAARLHRVPGVHEAITVGVADKNTHGDDEAGGAVHPIQPHLDVLLAGNISKRDGNGTSTNRDHAAIRRAAASNCAATSD
jgi:hypothetical protein